MCSHTAFCIFPIFKVQFPSNIFDLSNWKTHGDHAALFFPDVVGVSVEAGWLIWEVVVWQCWWMLVGCFDMGYMSHIWRLHLEEQ
jgi:hypothetical protein